MPPTGGLQGATTLDDTLSKRQACISVSNRALEHIRTFLSHTNLHLHSSTYTVPLMTNPVLIIGAGVSGLLLAQHLRRENIPFRIFERDADLTTRGVGWGLTLHWSLPAIRALIPEGLVQRLPEAYVDRIAVENGAISTFPFFDLSTGELKASTPKAPESQRIRVTREGIRKLLATGIDIEVRIS